MNGLLDAVMVTIVLSNLLLLGSARLMTYIRVAAAQGILLGAVPFMSGHGGVTGRVVLLAAAIMCMKGFVFPWLLLRAIREANVRREVEPFVGYTLSLAAGLAALGVALWACARFPIPIAITSALAVPGALFTVFTGLFLIVSRRKALTQVLGYLVMENGIYAFGISLVGQIPALVELGIMLDVFLAVFVMGIAVYQINREFDHMDADQLDTLKG